MRDSAVDHNLLFGILALQNNFISRESLVAAFRTWMADKSRRLGDILCEQGRLAQPQDDLLRALTDEHLRQHDNDPERSLAAVSSVGSLCDDLRKLNDPQAEATLAFVPQPGTKSESASAATGSAGQWSGTGQRFRVLRPHAKGGLGEVSVAHDAELNREVALKEIQPQFSDDTASRSRFVLEAEITGGLEHPGIVPVYGLGQYADGRPYYAMRFIRGDSLQEAIKQFHKCSHHAPRDEPLRGEPSAKKTAIPKALHAEREGYIADFNSLEFRKLLGRFIDVCQAIEYAHSRGVLHRDLKPGNIMLGKYGETLVVDWGLAKAAGTSDHFTSSSEAALVPSSGSAVEPTQMGAAIGTPAYMSPEQAFGELDQLGPATDVYSLGATLYHVLTGQSPLINFSLPELIARVQRGEFRRPSEINSHVPKALEAICLKAMALRPVDRYPTAAEIAEEIEHWLADEPVACLAEPLAVRARRWMKRHRTLVTSSAAAVAVLVTSLIVLLVLVAGHNRTLDAKNRELDDANTQLAQVNADLQSANASERAAKQDAEQKRIAADKARDETKQVLDYLVAAFRKSDPDIDGETLTVSALFGQAAEQLETTFPNQPLIQAQLLNAIGDTYQGLGLYPKAAAMIERASDLFRNELGEDHRETLGSMSNLALAYEAAGRLPEALPILERTLKLMQSTLGPEHPDTLSLMNNLAFAYKSAGRLAEALPLYEQTLELRQAKLGAQHPDTLMSLNNLASAYEAAGRLAEALPLFQRTLELKQATLGPEHSSTLISLNNLAGAYEAAGRLEEALPLYEQTLKLRKVKLGHEHPDTLMSMNNLASAYEAAGRLAEALPLYEQTLKLCQAQQGSEHPMTLTLMSNLGLAYGSAGRLTEALPHLEQALALRSTTLGREHPDTLQSMGNLASAYLVGNQPEKALPEFERFVAGFRRRVTPDNPGFAGLLAAVSLDLLQHRQYAAAETYLRECLTIREKKLPDDWVLFNTQSMLGAALAGQQKFAEAEPLLVAGYFGMKNRAAQIPPAAKTRLPEAIQHLIDLYTAWEKPEPAAEWQRKLDLRQEMNDP